MSKRTAIIDIGSNSARLVIYQSTSKNGFHLLCEKKSRVRIGEGAYQNGGNLQQIGIDRATNTLESFSQTINEYKVKKVIAVATSALRDAPNKKDFIDEIKDRFGIKINVIDGKEEASLGAIAASNLLPVASGITIDIGGGSSDMALIKNGKIVDTYSLDLGTVRLKELFFDKNTEIEIVREYIQNELDKLPKKFKNAQAIGIGGTIRSLAKAIISQTGYPLDKLHAFEYKIEDQKNFFKDIVSEKQSNLGKYGIKENRFDTIREGTLIFLEILKHIGAQRVITSGVGVREGVYLKSKFPAPAYRIPKNINPSIRSIRDRFDMLAFPIGNKKEIAKKLLALFKNRLKDDIDHRDILYKTLSLSDIGKSLTIYHEQRHASYIAMEELNFGITHCEALTISLLLYSKVKRGYNKDMYKKYKTILPGKNDIKWLSFIYTLTLILHESSSKAKLVFNLEKNLLHVKSNKTLYLAKSDVDSLKKPEDIKIVFD